MEKTKITIGMMRKLKPGAIQKFADEDLRGFQVWVGKRTISYYLIKKFDGKQHNIRLGQFPGMMLEEAKAKAIERLGAVMNHEDIQSSAGRRLPVLRDVIDFYMQSLDEKTKKYVKTYFNVFFHIANKKIADLKREDFLRLHNQISKRSGYMANRSIAYIRSAINKFIRTYDIEIKNPAANIKFNHEKPRKRFLLKDEASALVEALKELQNNPLNSVQADALLCMIYTGARKSNVLRMEIEELYLNLDEPSWVIPAKKSKNSEDMTIPLNGYALEIIKNRIGNRKSGFVFLYRGKVLAEVKKTFYHACAIAGLDGLVIHDLRRSMGSWMLMNGTPIEIVSKALGHKDVHVTMKHYAHMLTSELNRHTASAIDLMLGKKK